MPHEHYFHEAPASRSDERTFDVVLPDTSFRLTTDRGVFSHGHLDTGTALLLREAPPPPPTGDLLDLGCGAGPLAITLARRAPGARVWALDVNERARELCRRNAERAGVDLHVVAPDEVPTDVRFATIWSNPPIRIGKAALHELLERWIGRLTPDGRAVLVVQRHLGADSLAAWFSANGYPTVRLASRAGFRVLAVSAVTPAP